MNNYQAPFYTESQLEQLQEDDLSFPFSDKDATYLGKYHQYELTEAYFLERGVNLQAELDGDDPEKVKHFLAYLRVKVYQYVYNHCAKNPRNKLNYLIAKRGLRGYTRFEYRTAFLEAMFLEGKYLVDNGDLSGISGVDFDTMQSLSKEVLREEERDFHKDAVSALKTLGLKFYGSYSFVPQGNEW